MSYCRWSSDNWRCDLYCYEDVSGGWTTHVAGNRVVGDIPKELDILTTEPAEWVAAHNAVLKFLDTAERKDIDLPHAGETFNDPTLEAFKERLLELRGLGYNFPDYVLEDVDREITDLKNEGATQ